MLEEAKLPPLSPEEVLVRVGGAGMCRSDVQLVDGYFRAAKEMDFPMTPGHEIAGLLEATADRVPGDGTLSAVDQVVVAGRQGDGI